MLMQAAVQQNLKDRLNDKLPEIHNPGSFYFYIIKIYRPNIRDV